MAIPYWFRDGTAQDSTTILPVAGDPTYTITGMDLTYSIGNCVVIFTDASGTPVTPTAGTIRFEATPIEGQWLEPPAEMTIDATTVIAASDGGGTGLATYTLPSFDGPVQAARIILTGVEGATHVRSYHWRAST